MNAVPDRVLTVPLLKANDFSRTPRAVALILVIVTDPSVRSVADMVTCEKFLLASWVRNGNPPIVTVGLRDRPCCSILVASTFCATILAAKSATTRTTTMTASVMIHRRDRRPAVPALRIPREAIRVTAGASFARCYATARTVAGYRRLLRSRSSNGRRYRAGWYRT